MPSSYPPNSTLLKFSVREQIGWPVWFVFGFFWTILPKNGYLFAHFSFFLKKVASFSRAQASWFSRGRLARQAPAFGWDGHRGRPTSRWSDIAVVRHRCGRTSRCVVIQLVTHHHGHTTRTIYLTTIRNQWLYTIKVFPGKMIHPVKAPRPVAPRWRKKIAEEASVENGQHILLGQIYSGANSSSAKIFTLAEVLRQGMKMFHEKIIWIFFSKSWKQLNSQNKVIIFFSIYPTISILR